ncbi:MAG: hypothetical protein WCP29_02290 [Acidobacteriota bacterium]
MANQGTESEGRAFHILPWLLALIVLLLYVDNARRLERLSSIMGYVSAFLFIVANAYYPARVIARRFRPMPDSVIEFFKKYLDVHIWMNEVAFVAMAVHAHYADDKNIVLTALGIVTLFLTVEGLVMHYRLIPADKKLLRLLHNQQILFVVWVLLIIIGHSMV